MSERNKFLNTGIVISLTLLCVIIAFKNNIIVQFGIRFFRIAKITMTGIVIIILILNLMEIYKNYKTYRRKKRILESTKNEQKKEPEPVLSVSDKLDIGNLKKMMGEYISGSWKEVESEGREIISQLNEMDGYRRRLHNLLKNNDASALKDTESIFEEAEQYLGKNVRKVLNYMSIGDEKDKKSLDVVKKEMSECAEDNGYRLEEVKDFAYAITEYLNHQGEDYGNIIDMINTYRNTLLKSIQRE